jgi:hypothetical protein
MKKRHFLAAAGGTLALPASAASSSAGAAAGPGLLTVTGAVGRGNRGPLDPALDQMMAKQQLHFERAHVFDFEALSALPAVTLKATLEYDARPHELRGPLLTEVLRATGAPLERVKTLVLRAVDGYTVPLPLAQAQRYRFIVATHLDGRPMALGGLGPLWAVYAPDAYPDRMGQPLPQRYAQCPWGLYHIEVQA